ncbi:hypothetical protein [Ktedonobacter robiniae]|uniref:Uncharacterized protein n=1 Tax=Ktedonobacter robiniae TaxID=2778365 RepID=A0ABQ3UGH3_9CHLR|nr:hypothetical protein [Ktedonobacter robiniae]GHO51710.1 hypothetical protein KSB_01850 [Ktedonobacter robiniae]
MFVKMTLERALFLDYASLTSYRLRLIFFEKTHLKNTQAALLFVLNRAFDRPPTNDPVAFYRQVQQHWDSRAKEKHKMAGQSKLAWTVPDEESGVV